MRCPGSGNSDATRTSIYDQAGAVCAKYLERLKIDLAELLGVAPTIVRTELTAPLLESMGQEKFEALVSAHAMRRLGRPEEISRAILFLHSEEASFITGVALPVDDGYLLKG
jgi:NAD(P)-dependent dehydrogenase (short-subunit alcohol dehydrogenase family)